MVFINIQLEERMKLSTRARYGTRALLDLALFGDQPFLRGDQGIRIAQGGGDRFLFGKSGGERNFDVFNL